VAAGEKLNLNQAEVAIPKGWAIESRVYAEDPYRNFLPSIGRLKRYVEPTSTNNSVRVDSGVEEGDTIGVYYDPLISKTVTYGPTRAAAIERMSRALDTYIIRGLNHNIPFLRSVMENARFKSGNLSTKFIAEEYPDGFHGHPLEPHNVNQLIGSAAAMHISRAYRDYDIPGQVDATASPPNPMPLYINIQGKDYYVIADIATDEAGEPKITLYFPNEENKKVVVRHRWLPDSTMFRGLVDKERVVLQLVKPNALGLSLLCYGSQFDVTIKTPEQHRLTEHLPHRQADSADSALRSPMPGLILAVAVKKGDKVVKGQELCTIEAMKMQNVLRAERDGVVADVPVSPGASVQVDDIIIDFQQQPQPQAQQQQKA